MLLASVMTPTIPTPTSELISPNDGRPCAPLLELDLPPDEEPEPEPEPEVEAPLALVGAVGVKVALGLAMQELATALALAEEDGGEGLTVPFPAKLQACGSRLLSS